MKKICHLGIALSSLSFYGQVGINTNLPDPSAIIEVSADAPPGSVSTAKKGLLLPRVALSGSNDTTTIPNPARGLLIINTADSGTYPNEVLANEYYYWDGFHWERLVLKSIVDVAVKPRIFYVESNSVQNVPASAINFTVANDFRYVVATFTNTTPVSIGNIVTLNPDSSFTVNKSGLYDFSGFINFNPMKSTGSAFLNLVIQISTDGGLSWTNSPALTRTAWGENVSSYLKSATIQSFPVRLDKDTKFRLAFFSPFPNSDFGNTGITPYVGTTDHLPISKGLRIQLLDFNL